MNTQILQNEVQDFLNQNRDVDPAAIALKKSPFLGITASELAVQIDGRQRCVRKLPLWAMTPDLYFPPKLNLEQSSSEQTGLFKSRLLREGTTLLDLTGGFGVDSFFFAKTVKNVVSCERNSELALISLHNAQKLGAQNIQIQVVDGIDLLRKSDHHYDYIYVDPSRRSANRKVFLLQDCEPNVELHQSLFFKHASTLLIKLSPLLDIKSILSKLENVCDVYAVSVDNDCKELLVLQRKNYHGPTHIHAVRLFHGMEQQFCFTYEEEHDASAEPTAIKEYLYEPDVALTKAGAFKIIALRYSLGKLHPNTHLYTSDKLVTDFPGKIYKTERLLPFSTFKKQKINLYAGVVSKNFPLKSDEIRKKFKILEDKQTVLFFTTTSDNQLSVIEASRLSQ